MIICSNNARRTTSILQVILQLVFTPSPFHTFAFAVGADVALAVALDGDGTAGAKNVLVTSVKLGTSRTPD